MPNSPCFVFLNVVALVKFTPAAPSAQRSYGVAMYSYDKARRCPRQLLVDTLHSLCDEHTTMLLTFEERFSDEEQHFIDTLVGFPGEQPSCQHTSFNVRLASAFVPCSHVLAFLAGSDSDGFDHVHEVPYERLDFGDMEDEEVHDIFAEPLPVRLLELKRRRRLTR